MDGVVSRAPCRKRDGTDCPDRCVGCHAECEAYLAYRAHLDREMAKRVIEYQAKDLSFEGAMRRRRSLRRSREGLRIVGQNTRW